MEPGGYASVAFPEKICSQWICILQEIKTNLIRCFDSYCLLFRTVKRLILYCIVAEEYYTVLQAVWYGNPYSSFPHDECHVIQINKTTNHWIIMRKSGARLEIVKISTHRCSMDLSPGLSQVTHLFWGRNVKLQSCLCAGQVQCIQWQNKTFCTIPSKTEIWLGFYGVGINRDLEITSFFFLIQYYRRSKGMYIWSLLNKFSFPVKSVSQPIRSLSFGGFFP